MKATTLLAVLAMLLISSCQKAKTVTAAEEKLNLFAPSGRQIAKNVAALKNRVGEVIIEKYGAHAEFEMTAIEYLPVKKGFAALVSFRLSNGTTGNYITLSGVNYRLLPSGLTILPGEPEAYREITADFICIKKEECTAECYAKAKITEHPDTHEVDIDCGCNRKCEAKRVN